ncbi:Uncharacterized protein FWK35_00030130 [Aphis craccivora]|uniref:Uncharacterized protein n=1 Tax=Aphis craccivora TaxID=307492 RepID=A0A6G0ZIY8_APHCR|nr:Uncharacterized protein FWK35_00030130 [Aphis craccivora]
MIKWCVFVNVKIKKKLLKTNPPHYHPSCHSRRLHCSRSTLYSSRPLVEGRDKRVERKW